MAIKNNEQGVGWAIINSAGNKFCEYDSLDGFVDSGESSVPTEPQENGSLYSYDKVRQPSTATVELLFKGDYSKQGAALAKLNNYLGSTEQFIIQTPNSAFENMTVVGVSVSRSATENMNMLVVEVTFKEVMHYQSKSNRVYISSPANASSVSSRNIGDAQKKEMTKAVAEAQSIKEGVMGQLDEAVSTVKEKWQGVKESVSSAVSTVKENIETVRSSVSSYVDKARAVQNWARSQMVSINSEVSAVKSTFTVVKEVTSLNGIKGTFWSGVNNAKSTVNVGKSILKGFE